MKLFHFCFKNAHPKRRNYCRETGEIFKLRQHTKRRNQHSCEHIMIACISAVYIRSVQHLDSTCVYFTCLFIYLFVAVAVLYEKLETSSHTLIVRIYILVLSHCYATTVLCVYSVQNLWHSIDVVCFK